MGRAGILKKKLNSLLKKENLNIDLEKVLQSFTRDKNIQLKDYHIKKVLNRPFSLVLNIDIFIPDSETLSIFLKIYKPFDRLDIRLSLEREYEITMYWFNKFRESPSFHTVEPLWVDFNKFILITRESSGIDLLSFLRENVRFFPSRNKIHQAVFYLEQVGKWLSYFQHFPIDDDIPFLDTSVNIEPDYFINYINTRMERMISNPHILFDSQMQKKINVVMQRLLSQIDFRNSRLSVAHSDFSLSNILINNDHITVLDFHNPQINSTYKDLSRLYHQLHLLSFRPEYSKKLIGRLQNALLRGWGEGRADQTELFKVYFLIHQITHLGKIARYWEHNFIENIYNRWVVHITLKQLKKFLDHEV